MRIAVVGDVMLDMAVEGQWNGVCPENKNVYTLKGNGIDVLAGGAGNVATILFDNKVTVDLFADGPGVGRSTWVGDMFKSSVRANKVIWSGHGNIPVKIRGYNGNDVVIRLDAEDGNNGRRKQSSVENLLIDIDKYDAIIISDYCKGVVDEETMPIFEKIISAGKNVIVDSKRIDYSIWSGATALVPNADEAWHIYNTKDPSVVRTKANVDIVAITNAGNSIDVACGGFVGSIPISSISNPFNVGAGDAFAAGLAIGLSKSGDYKTACYKAIETARKFVSKKRKCRLR